MSRERRWETRLFFIGDIGARAHFSLLRRNNVSSRRRVFGAEVEHVATVSTATGNLVGSHGVILLVNLGLLRIELGISASGWR